MQVGPEGVESFVQKRVCLLYLVNLGVEIIRYSKELCALSKLRSLVLVKLDSHHSLDGHIKSSDCFVARSASSRCADSLIGDALHTPASRRPLTKCQNISSCSTR